MPISLHSYTVMITITVAAMKMMTMMVVSSHETDDENGEIEIIIAKQRNGPTGTVKLHFMKQYNKFTDIDYAHADMM